MISGTAIACYKMFTYLRSSSKEPEAAEARVADKLEIGTNDAAGSGDIFLDDMKKQTKIRWYTVRQSDERLRICGEGSNGTLTFCPINGTIVDENGELCKGNRPSIPFLKRYATQLENLKVPDFEFSNNRHLLTNFKDTYYDEVTREYKNTITGNVVSGFRIPLS